MKLSITSRLMTYSVSMVILVVSLVASILLYYHHKGVFNEFELRKDSVIGAFAKELELSLLLEDVDDLKKKSQVVLGLQDVASVSVFKVTEGEKGALLYEESNDLESVPLNYRDVGVKEIVSQPTVFFSDEGILKASPDEAEVIGRVEVIFSTVKINSDLTNAIYLLLLFTVILIALKIIVDYFFIKSLTAPIVKLVNATKKVSEGDLDHRIEVNSDDEIGKLGNSFNVMVKTLKDREVELYENQKLLQEHLAELQEKNLELKEAKNLAESANRIKGEFLANMSHELRTPLNAVLGFTQILKSVDDSKTQGEFLDIIHKSSEELLSLLSDILDLSNIESGKLGLEEVPFNIAEIIESTIVDSIEKAKGKGLEFNLHLADDLPLALFGDAIKLKKIINNLVDNAIKFTQEGCVDLEVKVKEAHKLFATLYISISDTGIGIPHDKQELIFDSFSQVDGSLTRKYGGTGLGTSLAKKYSQLMGGEIWFESNEGEGSKFHIVIPFKFHKVAKVEFDKSIILEQGIYVEDKPLAADKGRKKILVVEDEPLNQKMLKNALKKRGYQVDIADNGQIALEMWMKEDYSIIFMDIQMPVMNGLEAAKNIRQLESERDTYTPIIAVTAHAMSHEKVKCQEVGMDEFITKPVNIPKMFKTLTKYVR